MQTFGSLSSAVARAGSVEVGKIAHRQIVIYGFELDTHAATSLVALYSRCRKVNEALQVFERVGDKDVIFWTTMISGLVQNDSADKALIVFQKMLASSLWPSAATMACVLAACAQLGSIKLGMSIHCYILKQQMQSFTIFSTMEIRGVVSWNTIISGYAQNECLTKALHFFQEMRVSHQNPDSVTVASLLQACASIGAYHQGRWIHNFILKNHLGQCIKTSTALVDMYAKCGDLNSARKCFYKMPCHDAVSWSTIIAGLGSHGKGETALEMYLEYLDKGFEPNGVIFLSILCACSHNGLVDKGMNLFESMINDYKIEPEVEHLACIVDLLCRGGRIQEAYDFHRKMFSEPMVDVLGILLDACPSMGQEELGCIIAEEISESGPIDAGKYVQLAHSFASVARWDGVGEAWAQIRFLGLRKSPGWSFLEMHGMITPFFTRHNSHSEYASIVSVLRDLTDYSMGLALMSDDEDLFN
ncbi:hypothetical protein OROGR_012589 [Orobanche gracilis]